MRLSRQDFWQLGALCLISAGLFFSSFRVNEWLLETLEYSQYINWIFLPGGIRVVIVMVMGLPGALGLVLGSWAVTYFGEQEWGLLQIGNGLISGLTPWMVMRLMFKEDVFNHPRIRLTPDRLLAFVVSYALVNALLHHGFWWTMHATDHDAWNGFVPMMVGDLLGALVLLYLLKWSLDKLTLPAPPEH